MVSMQKIGEGTRCSFNLLVVVVVLRGRKKRFHCMCWLLFVAHGKIKRRAKDLDDGLNC